MQSTTKFSQSFGIVAKCERWHENPANRDWQDADHWKCVLKGAGSQMTIYFSMGYGHNGKAPKAADILDCLASDAASYENAQDFEDWAPDFGYDTDSRKAEGVYKAVSKGAAKLKRFLGPDAYETLLWNTERL